MSATGTCTTSSRKSALMSSSSARRSTPSLMPASAWTIISSVVRMVERSTISVRPSPRSVKVTTELAPSCQASSGGSSKASRSGLTTSVSVPAVVISAPSSDTDVTRMAPPGRRSSETSSGAVLQSRGPHQAASWSGCVQASHTASRGASNTRVTVISCAVTASVMSRSLSCRARADDRRGGRSGVPRSRDTRPASRRLLERGALEARRAQLRAAPAGDQPGALEHLEVLGDGLDA